jgi:hypothetical protein
MSDTNVNNSAEQQVSAYKTDLVTCHGCQYLGTGTEANGDLVDFYYDPSTCLVFKVVSEHNIDTVIYAADLELTE